MAAGAPHQRVPTPGERRLKQAGLWLGPVAALASLWFTRGLTGEQQSVVAVTLLMAAWWMTEALPMWATACVAFVVLPLAGAASLDSVLALAGNSLVWLFIGGMLIARAIEASGLHRRIALRVLRFTGRGPRGLVLGLMIAGAGLSMFVSNSATALMLFPIARSLVEGATPDDGSRATVGAAAMLGLAYGCNAGGAASLIGTPPNLIMVEAYDLQFPDGPSVGFFEWLLVGVPFLACFLPVAWLYLTRIAFRLPHHSVVPVAAAEAHAAQPAWSPAQRRVALVFGAAALAWLTRGLWGPWLPWRGSSCDAAVALTGAAALFLGPRTPQAITAGRAAVLRPFDLGRIPWGLIVLIGGGLVLSSSFAQTGLTGVAGEVLAGWHGADPAWLVGGVACAAVVLSAFTSNTGSAGILAPVLMAAAPALGLDARLLLFAAAMGVSCDFMLPVGTPPNAIVFGSGWLHVAAWRASAWWWTCSPWCWWP
ncbi:MAG: SLC13 family permease [Planctomycetota bacterium]|jgi:sodium-dependent dicarboxylate transporter 2/3/5